MVKRKTKRKTKRHKSDKFGGPHPAASNISKSGIKKPKEYKVASGLPGADRISIGYHGRGAKAYAAEVVKLGNQTSAKTGGTYRFKTEVQRMPAAGKTKAGNQRHVTVHRIHVVKKNKKRRR